LPEGVWPQTKSVAHTNICDMNVKLDERTNRVIVLAALDNLVKGAAGQAVQNMNLLFGFDETEGLK
jgi:N-acetyl-gamma-glutamyl-phosphate reductase